MPEPKPADGVVVTGLGMVTSIGYEAKVAGASARAGMQRFLELEGESDREGNPVTVAPVEFLRSHPMPLVEMMNFAAVEAYSGAFGKGDRGNPKLWVSLSTHATAAGPGRPLGRYPLERLHAALAHVPLAPDCEIRAGDHAGVFAAVADGVRRLQSGAATACLIGGVDSLLSTERLADLDARDRLKTRYNPHGIVPGEAAVFLVVELEAEARRRKAAVWARLSRVGLGREPRPIGSDEPCLAEGLTEAILKATPESVQPRPLLGVVCDLNGEPYRAGEWGLARPRATAWAREVLLSHPADCLGDVGAAAGALLVGLASIAIHERYAVSPELLVWAGSDDGSRAAVFVGAASEAK